MHNNGRIISNIYKHFMLLVKCKTQQHNKRAEVFIYNHHSQPKAAFPETCSVTSHTGEVFYIWIKLCGDGVVRTIKLDYRVQQYASIKH
jgi:hypothetical protein